MKPTERRSTLKELNMARVQQIETTTYKAVHVNRLQISFGAVHQVAP